MEDDDLLLKQMFPALKKWYGPAQKAKYGDLPMFWQDLKAWSNTRSVVRDFNNDQQKKDQVQQERSTSIAAEKWSDVLDNDPIESLPLADRKLILARLRLEDVMDRLSKVVVLAQEAERDPNRSPSPEPIYNHEGIRINTREVRMRNKLSDQKKQLLDEMLRLRPLNSGGGALLQAASGKVIQRKIYMPVKDFPGRNFIGLIIGPRGNTQKRLEQESNCKISIRGKGSVKAGRQGKPEDEQDELHVIITGESEENVDKAAEKVEELLRPLDDQDNVHKQQQLRELAIYNGTFRDLETCHHCGEKGHKQWECPKKRAETAPGGRGRGPWNAAVQCKYCGERSHPSSDCPTLRVHPPMPGATLPPAAYPAPPGEFPPPAVPAVDQGEFMDFWQEVSAAPTPGTAAYNRAPVAAPQPPYYAAPQAPMPPVNPPPPYYAPPPPAPHAPPYPQPPPRRV